MRAGIVVVAFPENPDVTIAILKNRISQTQREGVAVSRFGGTIRLSLSGNDVSSSMGTGFTLANNAPGLFILTGDSSKSAQENLQRTNSGSVSSSGTISIVAARRRSVRR